MRILTKEDVERILEYWTCPVDFHKFSKEDQLRYLIELTEQWVMEALKKNWCKPEEGGLESKTVCCVARNHRTQFSNKAKQLIKDYIQSDDPAEESWEYWLDPKNHRPEDEWGL